MPEPHVGEAAARTDGAGPTMGDMHMAGALAARESECTPPASSVINDEDCTHAATDGEDTAATDDPGMESLHHALPTTADSAATNHEACVQPLMGDSGDRVSAPEQEGEIPRETEQTSADAEDVGYRDDGDGNNLTIVTRMRRKPLS